MVVYGTLSMRKIACVFTDHKPWVVAIGGVCIFPSQKPHPLLPETRRSFRPAARLRSFAAVMASGFLPFGHCIVKRCYRPTANRANR